ncbi:MAG: hypothetical protein HIU82_02030 [Proteobacteria bacterium]|nr:hypothetical protein [Pseudomonadota bacterium]
MQVVITSGEGVTGALIRWYTWSWAAHAGFVLDDGTILDATPALGVANHPKVAGGVVRRFAVKCPSGVAEDAVAWARRQVGDPYDWSAIYGMAWRRDWHRPGKWFCSELVARAFEVAGCPLLCSAQMDRVTPRDLLMSPLLREVGT